MTIRTMLAVLTGTATDPAAVGAASAVAARFDAHVDALFVQPDPQSEFRGFHPQEGWRALIDEMAVIRAAEAEAGRRAAEARRHFDAACASAGVPLVEHAAGRGGPSAHFRQLTGGPEVITREGRLTDLLVFGHVTPEGERHAYALLETALLAAGRPLLVVPSPAPAGIGGAIAIAWHGNVHAARAVAGALPFLERAGAVHVLTVETDEIAADEGRRLAGYLARHGIDAAVAALQPARRAVGELLLGKAAELGCDLLVMGGYGHGRLREVILGGITRHVLTHPALPVLIAH